LPLPRSDAGHAAVCTGTISGTLALSRRTHTPEVRMNIGEIVREVEVMPVDEPAVPEREPAREEPVSEPQPA